MFDFNDVHATNKAEQIRAWAVEQAVDIARTVVPEGGSVNIVDMAAELEQYVKTGKKDKEET